ncbi:MAG TPA: phytoene desaturase family protein [Gemmatimonadaceae bacterium]|nr:phytoene desaturase family protein [Gemmatimonadaceae bacterium]
MTVANWKSGERRDDRITRKRTRRDAPGRDVAVVIGAGLGGLAAAVRLRAMGWRVVLVEALDQPGGRARVFHRDGFTFDAGPTVITAPHLIAELFELVGRDPRDYYSLVPVDPFYRILFDDGSALDYVGDEERLLAQIARFEPRDVDGYRRLARTAERIFETGFTQLADRPFHRLSDMLRVVPAMARLQSWRSVHGLVARHIRDPRLRQALTFEPLLVGGDPFHTSSIYLLIHWLERKWGVHFALGGTASIVGALVRLLEELDVDIRLDTPIDEIVVEHGRAVAVRTAGGERIACGLVVSNADPSSVYTRLLAPRHRRRHSDRAVARVRQSMSLFVGYFGTTRTYPSLAHHTILLGPRYRGLLDDVFRRRVLAEDFSLYLHAPTRTDPSLAPPGCETFYVLSPVPNTRAGIDWEHEAEPYRARIMASLERRLLPHLGESVVTSFHMTPADFERTLRSVDGAAFGPEPLLTQSAWFRYHNRSPDVAGLYFVGAGTHPGGGIPGVLCSAKVLERVAPRPTRA